MFENNRGSIDTDQSASYTQRSIRVSAIIGDPIVDLPSANSFNPFSLVRKSNDNSAKKSNDSPELKIKKPLNAESLKKVTEGLKQNHLRKHKSKESIPKVTDFK